jgi:hypothetical protein
MVRRWRLIGYFPILKNPPGAGPSSTPPQGGAAQRFVAQVGSFRVSKQLHHHTAGHSTTLAGTHAGTPPRNDSAPELADTPAAHSNPLYTPESSKQMVDYDGMDYKQRFQAKLAARRAAAAAGENAPTTSVFGLRAYNLPSSVSTAWKPHSQACRRSCRHTREYPPAAL